MSFQDYSGIESEDISGEERITDPFNPASIRVETRLMPIDLLLSRIALEELDLQPGFQHKGDLWNETAQSRLIESLLLRIPLPAFYVDATENKWLVIDGLQRLATLKRFILDTTLKLRNLEFLGALEGKTYPELLRPFQRRITEAQVTVHLIEKGTSAEVKFNIFKRITTGGLPLSAQEIRHTLNQGKASNMLVRLAASVEFLQATDHSIRDNRMADRECVLRFLAFTLTPYTGYKSKEYNSFLNDCMAKINTMPDQEVIALEERFLRAMRAAHTLFRSDAFRKRLTENAPRFPINKALFESWSVNLDQLDDQQLHLLEERKELLRKRSFDLMKQQQFLDAISQGTGDIGKVHYRFREIRRIIEEVLLCRLTSC